MARARKGERFAELARDNSDSVTAKSYGHSWTLTRKAFWTQQLENQVWDQPKGYITDPIPIKAGF